MQAIGPFVLAVFFLVAFYVMIVRPQKKRVLEHDELVASLQVGDVVMTTAGVCGVVRQLGDDYLVLGISDGVDITVARWSAGLRPDDLPAAFLPVSQPAPTEAQKKNS